MGKAVACQLAEKGAHVVVVARTVKKLENAVEDMKASSLAYPPHTQVISTDRHPPERRKRSFYAKILPHQCRPN